MRLLVTFLLLCSVNAFAFTEEELVSQTVNGVTLLCAQSNGTYLSVTKEKGEYLSTSSLIKKLKVRISRTKNKGRKARFQKKLSSLKRAYAKAKPFCRSLNPTPTPKPTPSPTPTAAPTATRREEIHPLCVSDAEYQACYEKKGASFLNCQDLITGAEAWGYTEEEAKEKALLACKKELRRTLDHEWYDVGAKTLKVTKPCYIGFCELSYVFVD